MTAERDEGPLDPNELTHRQHPAMVASPVSILKS